MGGVAARRRLSLLLQSRVDRASDSARRIAGRKVKRSLDQVQRQIVLREVTPEERKKVGGIVSQKCYFIKEVPTEAAGTGKIMMAGKASG